MQTHPRTDTETAQLVREALPMQRAFGTHAAETFLRLRAVPLPVVARVLTEPERRRQF